MRLMPLIAACAAAFLLSACAERQATSTETDGRESRPPTAAEVPPVDIPPTMPPPPAGQTADPAPQPPPPAAPPSAASPAPTPIPGQPLETIETDSGLIIEVLREGTGDAVRTGDTVVVHYHGTLANGRVFDSTRERGEPLTINLFQTIRGWQEGIPGMRIGGQRRLIVPSDLGYGARARPNIPANSMLIFEIEVIDIVR